MLRVGSWILPGLASFVGYLILGHGGAWVLIGGVAYAVRIFAPNSVKRAQKELADIARGR